MQACRWSNDAMLCSAQPLSMNGGCVLLSRILDVRDALTTLAQIKGESKTISLLRHDVEAARMRLRKRFERD